MAGWDLVDGIEHGLCGRGVSEGHEVSESLHVGPSRNPLVLEERLDLRGEQKLVADPGVIERLYPETVACEHQ